MSGHNKWSTIKQKKGKNDAARAKVFTKIGRELIDAIKDGGSADPSVNSKLKDCIAKAKAANVPNDNIERIIKKASSDADATNYEAVTYEGYGPNGVAVIVEALTDNRNRTAGEVRHYFDKFGGNMGTQGCVSFMFSKKGVLVIEREDLEKDEDTVMSDALECGASDFEADDDVFTIYTETDDFGAVRDELEKLGYTFVSAEIEMVPSTYTKLEDDEPAPKKQKKLDMFKDVKIADFDEAVKSGMIEYVDESVYDTYLEKVMEQQVNPGICNGADLKVVYTPLNGTGNKLVRKVLGKTGVNDVVVVPEQELPDGNFTTCPYPNPEIKEALAKGLELCEKEQPDLLLATDPDADRVGIAVKDYDGSYRLISGNEDGVMLTNYILSCKKASGKLPEKPVVVKTIVTTKLINKLCEKYGCELKNVLTGFKYIGEVILNLEKKHEENRYLFGFEESYGYLSGTYVRDKDAVVASMLVCEMAAYYKKQGKSLAEDIDGLYEEFGYYLYQTYSFEFDGAAGMQKMSDIMTAVRDNTPKSIAGYDVVKVSDYFLRKETDVATGSVTDIDLPKSNVIALHLADDNAVIIRPSGTEPKIKLYITSVGKDKDNAAEICEKLVVASKEILGVE